ncbi:predicted protein [Chaetoceros tenuissimus]|uniref:Uncharacterized protein n=1 Tax=Chaetoceros tenuissimus TaxID=426638 RepID=A0AAD3GZJ5_9STRA|nr:predicted protein [Chaetoceros tenuissimus]
MDSESPSKLCGVTSHACRRPRSSNQNDENAACHSSQTLNHSTRIHSSNLSTGSPRPIALNESSNQVLGETESSPMKTTHVEKPFESSRMPTSNESSEQDENQASLDHASPKRKRNVQESNDDAETKKHKTGDIRNFFSPPSTASSTKRKSVSKRKKSRTASQKNRGQVDFYFLPKVDVEPKSPSIQSRSLQEEPSDRQDWEKDVPPLISREKEILSYVDKIYKDADLKTTTIRHINESVKEEFQIDELNDEIKKSIKAHVTRLVNAPDPIQVPAVEDGAPTLPRTILIYDSTRRFNCPPEEKKILKEIASKCLGKLKEDGHYTDPFSENLQHLNYGNFYQNYQGPAVYFHHGDEKVDSKFGSTVNFGTRMGYYQQEANGVAPHVTKVITLNSLTKHHADHVEKYRKQLLKEMGCSSEEPTSLQDFKNDPHFQLSALYYFEQKHCHTDYSKRWDLSFLESCVQCDNGYEDEPASMHEFLAASNRIFWNNYNFCSEKAAFLTKKMEEKSGYGIKHFTVGTWHEQYRDMFPKDAIPESSDIDECYDKKYLLKHRAEAQKNCRIVAENIKNGAQRTVNYVDTNEVAFSYDFEKNQEVKDADLAVAHHLQVYCDLGYEIFHHEDEMFLLYTKESNSFVYFLGPLCKLLGKFSFDTPENIKSATKRAVWAEILRQLCNLAKGRPDGGKDDIFQNILLAHYLSTVLHLQFHMPWRFPVLLGKDILTPREVFARNREFTQMPQRARNTTTVRSRTDRSGDRQGASTGDFESKIFYLALNIYSCYPLHVARKMVADLFRDTAGNLVMATVSARNINFGRGNYLSDELQRDWNDFYQSSVRQNSGNSNGRRQTPAEKKERDRCVGLLTGKAMKVIRANPILGGDFYIWHQTDDNEKAIAEAQNSDAQRPNLQFDQLLQLPYVHEGLRTRLKAENKKFKKSFRLGFHQVKPLVTRKNGEWKLAEIRVEPPP